MSNRKTILTDRLVTASTPTAREYSLRDTILPGLALRVRPAGAKTWVLRRAVNGVARRQSLGDACQMPVAEARAQAHALLANNDTDYAPSKKKGPSFRDFATTYRARRAGIWKPSGLRTYDVYLRCTLLPYFADMAMGKIGRTDVARWFHDYSAVRPGGANRALAILHTMFNRARDWGVLPDTGTNPCRGITRNRTAPRGRILNTHDLKRLGQALEQAATRWPDQVDAVRLVLFTGCRVGEILGLRWDELNEDRLELADSKTGPRRVLLGEPARMVLHYRRDEESSPFVFPRPSDPSLPRASIIGFWRMIRRQAGLTSDIRLHDLRHTFASQAVMQGETLMMTGQLLGHRHIATTQRYAHLEDRFLLQAAERVAAEILKRVEPVRKAA